MKNTTVKELIEKLSKLDPDAVVCGGELLGDEFEYFTFEIIQPHYNKNYMDDAGDIVKGDFIVLM